MWPPAGHMVALHFIAPFHLMCVCMRRLINEPKISMRRLLQEPSFFNLQKKKNREREGVMVSFVSCVSLPCAPVMLLRKKN